MLLFLSHSPAARGLKVRTMMMHSSGLHIYPVGPYSSERKSLSARAPGSLGPADTI
jgi:hypothetical protein